MINQRQYEKHSNDEIAVSIKICIKNLSKIELSLKRTKKLNDELTAADSDKIRCVSGSMQWVPKELLC